MGTAEKRETRGTGTAAPATARRGPRTPEHGTPAGGGRSTAEEGDPVDGGDAPPAGRGGTTDEEQYGTSSYRPLWVEEPARRRRLPDPVRTAAVRAVLIIAVTLIQAVIAFLCTLAGSWLAFPMVLSSVASTVVATWGALDVWVTRQVWSQRHGVVSAPSSTARALRRELRTARRQARAAERAQKRIRRQTGAGQLSHP
ncbi:hypothetical protein [Streptomyces sp. TP-A0356]|uniref:hypothetical protein n=1 Tax=Streptomyces sp. TP-A0356 TaxID=1359208 RepID=UPI0006E436F3|nr:hypothetical protein [Streptomyces sp. TP-A0356]